MKKISLIITGILFVAFAATGQSKTDLKGPKAKNYKPWKYEKVDKTFYTVDREAKKGPAAKNYKPWKEEVDSLQKTEIKFYNPKIDLKGPANKNHKPWKGKGKKVPAKPVESDTLIVNNN